MLAWMGPAPISKVKKWKLEPSQRRRPSLDTEVSCSPWWRVSPRGMWSSRWLCTIGAGGWSQSPPQTGQHHLLTSGHLAHELVRRMTWGCTQCPSKAKACPAGADNSELLP